MTQKLNKSYNAKILLFGEHLINLGSDALSIPYDKFKGSLKHIVTKEEDRLKPFIDFLKREHFEFLDDAKLAKLDTLVFDSNIPEGYGCGSSGAIVAACYDLLKTEKIDDASVLKANFSQMEAFFHGKSSGTDPLISYLNCPIRFRSNGKIQLIKELRPQLNSHSLILIDSGKARDGKVFIDWFMQKSSESEFQKLLETELIPSTQNCIDNLLSSDEASLIKSFSQISKFQLNHMQQMIPDHIETLWEKGLTSGILKLKLCGAGGGGFFIGLLKNKERLGLLDVYNYYSLF